MNKKAFPLTNFGADGLEGSSLYCSEEAAARLRSCLGSIPLRSVHLLGSGDRHYLTLFFLERIAEPFQLILFDNHPDDQPGAFGENLLSCGNWVLRARALPFCRGAVWVDGKGALHRRGEDGAENLPSYISVDLDILDKRFARTNWDQGEMTLDDLLGRLHALREERPVLGVDICGAPDCGHCIKEICRIWE